MHQSGSNTSLLGIYSSAFSPPRGERGRRGEEESGEIAGDPTWRDGEEIPRGERLGKRDFGRSREDRDWTERDRSWGTVRERSPRQ